MKSAASALWACLLVPGVLSAESVELESAGALAGPVDHVRARGGAVFISAGKTFSVVDASDPAAPARRGSLELPEQVWGFRIQGDRAYVGANFFGLGVVDISDPAAPRLVGRLETLGQVKIGAVFGSTVAVIDHMDGVVVGDVADEATPRVSDSYFVDGYGRDVVADGPMAYAVDSPAGLYVFDLETAAPAEPLGVLQEPGMARSIEVVNLPGGRRLVCGPADGDLGIYDVTDPAEPRRVTTFATPGRAHRVAVEGSLVFVADGEEGILVVDVTEPERARVVGSYRGSRPVRDLAVGASLVFSVEGESEYRGDDRRLVLLRRSDR